jgi:hypothetical protein
VQLELKENGKHEPDIGVGAGIHNLGADRGAIRDADQDRLPR